MLLKCVMCAIQIYGTVDLEQPATECGSTLVVVSLPVADVMHHLFTIPVHSKYPGAQASNRTDRGGGLSLFLGKYTELEVPAGVIMLKSSNGRVVVVDWESNHLSWVLPAGSMDHYLLVTIGTGITVLLSSLFLAWNLIGC